MNINSKKIKEVSELYEAIVQIESEIKELEAMIYMAANGHNIESKMKLTDRDLLEHENSKVGIDRDGSLDFRQSRRSRGYVEHPFFQMFTPGIRKKKPSKAVLKVEISNAMSIRILGMIIEEKKKEQSGFLKELQKLGFNIL